MPGLSEASVTGTVVEWRVRVADRVGKGQVPIRVESDRATPDLEPPTKPR